MLIGLTAMMSVLLAGVMAGVIPTLGVLLMRLNDIEKVLKQISASLTPPDSK